MTDKKIKEAILLWWKKLGERAMKVHCGGRGLAVGCPVCGKRWG